MFVDDWPFALKQLADRFDHSDPNCLHALNDPGSKARKHSDHALLRAVFA
jgi:hypothetical protein